MYDLAGTSFDDFMRDIEAEAEAEGPEAVAHLMSLQHRFQLASELVTLRKTRAVSQRHLAQATGIHQSEISRIERGVGNPNKDTLARLGRALGARLTFVLDGDGP